MIGTGQPPIADSQGNGKANETIFSGGLRCGARTVHGEPFWLGVNRQELGDIRMNTIFIPQSSSISLVGG